ncbi:MAG: dihydrolipoamide acetyltransferase family protein [Acidimicrobiales bacterium]
MADITMPQLGETVTEGTIIRWLKKVGDEVAHDEPLFEVSTDKVDSDVPSSEAGYLTEILVEEGATVDVGVRLAVVSDSPAGARASAGEAPETSGETEDRAPAAAPSAATEQPPAVATSSTAPAGTGSPTPEPEAAPANAEPLPAARASTAPASSTRAASVPGDNRSASLLSPVVRKLLTDNGIASSEVTGTGSGGRITRSDVLSYIDAHAGGRQDRGAVTTPAAGAPATNGRAAVTAPPLSSPAGPAEPGPGSRAAFPPSSAGERDEVVPFTNIRRLTAEHMVRSKATSAHTLVGIEADYEAIERVRRANKERFKSEEGFSLTYLAFVARAVVDVLRDFPQLNASIGEDALLVHRDVNLGIAVDLDRQGLIVPVVHNADGQSLRGLARAIGDLAERARSRRLSADDIVGGTFTITNPGPFGTFITVPIINQPQVAILSTDGVKRRPVVVTAEDGTEAVAIHSVGMLALSFDHRAVDGAYASAFLYNLARALETRDWSAEL